MAHVRPLNKQFSPTDGHLRMESDPEDAFKPPFEFGTKEHADWETLVINAWEARLAEEGDAGAEAAVGVAGAAGSDGGP